MKCYSLFINVDRLGAARVTEFARIPRFKSAAVLFSQLSLFFILLMSSASLRAEQVERISIVTEHWPPFNYLNDEGEVDGLATRLVKQVMAESGYAYDIELLSWSRAYQKAKNNKNVLLYTIYQLDNRVKDFQWICPLVITEGAEIYALAERSIGKIDSLEDLKRYSIGVINTGWSYEFFTNSGFVDGKHLDIVKDEMANIRKLFAGRVDLIVQEPELIDSRLSRINRSKSEVKSVFVLASKNSKTGCMAMSLDTPTPVINSLRKALLKVTAQ